jgi:hypothetical protein
MKSGASCGQAGDPAGNTSTSCGPLATGQRRVWDSSSRGWARPQWPAIVCGGDSRSCGAKSCSIPSRWPMCSSGPARRATWPAWPSSARTCFPGRRLLRTTTSRGRQAAGISNDNRGPAAAASPPPDGGGSAARHADPRLPSLDLAGAATRLSLYPNLLCLRPRGTGAPWGAPGQLAGHSSDRPVPSMASGWRRPGSLKR